MHFKLQPTHVIIKNMLAVLLGLSILSAILALTSIRMNFPWWARPERPIVLHTIHNMAEYNLGLRAYETAKVMGYPTIFISHHAYFNLLPLLNWSVHAYLHVLHWWYKPRWHLALTDMVHIVPPSPRYVFINAPYLRLIDSQQRLIPEARCILSYNGIIDINGYGKGQENHAWLQKAFARGGINSLPPIMTLSLGIPPQLMPPVQSIQNIMVFGSTWGNRGNPRYQVLFKKLAEQNLIDAYGPLATWDFIASHYHHTLAPEALLPTLHRHGVGLSYLSELANEIGIPSGRAFEIITAGAVMISDRNPFIERYFGDAVLYYDQNASGEVMAAQITHHLTMLKQHPEKANVLARQAQAIGRTLFPMENLFYAIETMSRPPSITSVPGKK
jgi:hypothetical protein